MFGWGVRGKVFHARARLVALHILQLGLGGFDMRRAALAICLLVTPAFGEAQLDYAIDQYTQCTRRAYLAEAAGPQFIADRNVTTAAEWSASSLDILAHLSLIIGLESEVFGRSDANE